MIYFDFKKIYDSEYQKRLVNYSFYEYLDKNDWSLDFFIKEILTKCENFSIIHPSYLDKSHVNYFIRVNELGLFIKGDFILEKDNGYFVVKDFIMTEAKKYSDYEIDFSFKIGIYNTKRNLVSDMALIKEIISKTSNRSDFKVVDFVNRWNEYLEFEKRFFKDKIGFYKSENYLVKEIYQVKRNFNSLKEYEDDIYYDDLNTYLYLDKEIIGASKYYVIEFEVSVDNHHNEATNHEEYTKLVSFASSEIEIANEKEALNEGKLVSKKELEYDFKTTKLGTILLSPKKIYEDDKKITYMFSKFYNDEDSYYYSLNQIREYIENNYTTTPLLVNILSGDISLYKRGKEALDRVKSGDLYNPYLVNYLFNIHDFESSFVRVNKEDLVWSNELLDEYQKEAVYKGLNSNSIFLLQGPPGTGKTQTISELVYQFNKLGKRVLLSSQTHVAIDNVLERLPNELRILPIRLVTSERKSKVDSLFLPNNVVNNLYEKISNKYEEKVNNYDIKKGYLLRLKKEYEEMYDLYNKYSMERDEYIVKVNKKNEVNKNIASSDALIASLLNEKNYFYYSNVFIEALLKKDFNLNSVSYSNQILIKDLNGYESFIQKHELDKLSDPNLSLYVFMESVINNDYYHDNVALVNDFSLLIKNNNDYLVSKKRENDLKIISLENKLKELSKENEKLNGELSLLEEIINKEYQKILPVFNRFDEYYYKMFNNVMFTSKIPSSDKEKLIAINNYLSLKEEELKLSEDKFKIYEDIYKDVMDYIDDDLINQDKTKYTRYLMANNVNVYALTCNATSRYLKDNNSYLKELDIDDINLNNIDFDVVIIDEVSKASDIELLIPVLYGKSVILVGDHRQLPPLFKYKENMLENLNESSKVSKDSFMRYQNLVETSLFKKLFSEAKNNKFMLIKQYRSHKQIMDIVNLFYDNKLVLGNKEEQNNSKEHYLEVKSHDLKLFTKDVHTYWINSNYDAYYNVSYEKKLRFGGKVSSSFYNDVEREITLSLLKMIDKGYKDYQYENMSVGVISLYKDQVNLLRKDVNNLKFENMTFSRAKISTVDEFQGKEEDIVIVNLVRNNKNKTASEFVKKFERINVALSRARKMLIIVGSKEYFSDLEVELEDLDDQSIKKVRHLYKDIYDLCKVKIDNPFNSYFDKEELTLKVEEDSYED